MNAKTGAITKGMSTGHGLVQIRNKEIANAIGMLAQPAKSVRHEAVASLLRWKFSSRLTTTLVQ
jgi:hypothetical protein